MHCSTELLMIITSRSMLITTAFAAFTWPTIAQQPSSFPAFIPVGEDTAAALVSPYAQVPSIGGQQIFNTNTGILADSTVNTGS